MSTRDGLEARPRRALEPNGTAWPSPARPGWAPSIPVFRELFRTGRFLLGGRLAALIGLGELLIRFRVLLFVFAVVHVRLALAGIGIDRRFGNLGQLLVGRLLFLECLVQQLRRIRESELAGP